MQSFIFKIINYDDTLKSLDVIIRNIYILFLCGIYIIFLSDIDLLHLKSHERLVIEVIAIDLTLHVDNSFLIKFSIG